MKSFFWASSLVLFSAFLFLAGCKNQKFDMDERFVDLYLDIRLAETAWGSDEERMKSMRKIILSQNNLTPTEVNSFLEKLKQHPTQWKLFFDKVNAKSVELQIKHKGE